LLVLNKGYNKIKTISLKINFSYLIPARGSSMVERSAVDKFAILIKRKAVDEK